MKRIEAIIRPTRLDAVKIALMEIGVTGLSAIDVRGSGNQRGHRESYRGVSYAIDLPIKVKLEIVVKDDEVEEVVEVIIRHAKTGAPGDGKIFILPASDALRIRTEERGDEAL